MRITKFIIALTMSACGCAAVPERVAKVERGIEQDEQQLDRIKVSYGQITECGWSDLRTRGFEARGRRAKVLKRGRPPIKRSLALARSSVPSIRPGAMNGSAASIATLRKFLPPARIGNKRLPFMRRCKCRTKSLESRRISRVFNNPPYVSQCDSLDGTIITQAFPDRPLRFT